MAEHNIVVFGGDHCGPEVVAEGIKVLKAIEQHWPSVGKFNLQEHLLGGCSIDATGSPLTDEALAAAKSASAVLLGAIGGPKWGTGAAWDMEPYSPEEVERVARLAGFLARRRGDKKVWSLDKANVLATSRLWRRVMTETFEKEFPDLKRGHDHGQEPRGLNGVVVTSNLFGDIISDEASVIPGSISLLPSASLSGIPDGKSKCNGIYEPIHGSAPDISGQGIVNSIGTILSVAMILRYSLNLPDEAKAVEDAIKAAIDGGLRTRDIGGGAGTKEVGDEVVKQLTVILKA
ncbi:3-isopropylmalate dehydrogenase [Tolypocladium ophioglossoides CBS 100239]|uniref:3-isopropylmalate dehydrogenase n=1 Tax=Tolypocladium ophioglossoides (strain CBS 100239) TaxID=1163406 RepID=A0A0L0N1N9_TOLOC|nr:3-isopropylmalate dehydrogenase [Tolypocladium ophioglossoides CBS 100239]